MNRFKHFVQITLIIIVLLSINRIAYASNTNEYYINFYNDMDSNVSIQIGTQTPIIDQAYGKIDLNNLLIPPSQVYSHYIFQASNSDISTLTKEIRTYLLLYGYARLEDEKLATENELEAQKQAKANNVGIWNSIEATNASSPALDDATDNAFWMSIKAYIAKNYQWIISILMGCGLITYFIKTIKKFLKTKKKIIFLGGANNCGKTTLRKLLVNSNITPADLLEQKPSLKLVIDRIRRTFENDTITLDARIIDAPGHDLYLIIDRLKRNIDLVNKYVIIIILSATKSQKANVIDQNFIDYQFNLLDILWTAVLKAQTTIRPESVVIFLNKNDLFDDKAKMESLFMSHKEVISKTCAESNLSFEFISGSLKEKVGMTELMQILKR